LGCIQVCYDGKKWKRTFLEYSEKNQGILRADNSKDATSDSSNSSTVEKKLLNLFEITLTPDTF